jgi:hypothetical protein
MNVKIYDIDYDKLRQWLLPARVRKVRILAFLKVMISGVEFLYQNFLRFRTAKLYQLMITPQVCYLERMLNDRFDFVLRRIVIVDAQDKPPFYIFQDAEVKPKYIRNTAEAVPRWIYTEGESGVLRDDFVILVPTALVFEEAEMRSLVKVYKLAGIKFKIQRV